MTLTSAQHALKRRFPVWLQGAFYGGAVWAIAFALALAFKAGEEFTPRWLEETVGTICMVVGLPVTIGGFLLVWGDDPPSQWLNTVTANVVFAISVYPILGGLAAWLIAWMFPGRGTPRNLFAAVAVAILCLGFLPVVWEWLD